MESNINPEVFEMSGISLSDQARFDANFKSYILPLASLINPASEESLFSEAGTYNFLGEPGTKEFELNCNRIMIEGLVKSAFVVTETENMRIARDMLVLPEYRKRAELFGIGYYDGRALIDKEVTALKMAPVLGALMLNPLKEKGWPKRLADEKSKITLEDLSFGLLRSI